MREGQQMGAVEVLNVGMASPSVLKAAVATGMGAVASSQAVVAKVEFTNADLSAVELEGSDVSAEMQGVSFGLSAVLPWFEAVRRDAASALAEM
jgi:hypothetical protein